MVTSVLSAPCIENEKASIIMFSLSVECGGRGSFFLFVLTIFSEETQETGHSTVGSTAICYYTFLII